MKVRASFALLAAIAFAALLLPGAANARTRPASRQTTPEVSARFALQGTNGFEFGASVTDRRRLTIGALKFGNVLQVVTYKLPVHRRRDSDDIVAGLGKLGRIDVRFVPGKVHREKPPKGCHGPKTVIEEGHFVGVIAFHGEAGFTEVHARRVAGAITHTPSFRCPSLPAPPNQKKLERELEAGESKEAPDEAEETEKEEEEAELEVLSVGLTAKARGGHVTLTARKVALKRKHAKGVALTNISVSGDRRLGRIEESSIAAYLFGKGSTFLVPNRKKPASEGILKPPAPFSGSATFRRHPKKQPTWTGDLKIALPGFGQVRLAGPGTRASMCEGTACLLRGTSSERALLNRPPWE